MPAPNRTAEPGGGTQSPSLRKSNPPSTVANASMSAPAPSDAVPVIAVGPEMIENCEVKAVTGALETGPPGRAPSLTVPFALNWPGYGPEAGPYVEKLNVALPSGVQFGAGNASTRTPEDAPPNVSPSSVGALASADAEPIAPNASSPASATAIRLFARRVRVDLLSESTDTISWPLFGADQPGARQICRSCRRDEGCPW